MYFQAPETLPLLDVLQQLFPESSKNSLRSWIEHGRVNVGENVAKRAAQMVPKGSQIIIGPKRTPLEDDLRVVYEDESLVVVEKPEGLLSVATEYRDKRTAHAILKRRFHRPRVYPVHRLDRETSGVMVFAYTQEAREGLEKQFEEHSIEREYRAVIRGSINPTKGTLRSYLREDAAFFVHTTSEDYGQLAITHYETLEKRGDRTLLRLTLETGRKNQVRVQLSEAGHPIIGDDKYGEPERKAKRLFLHALHLGFRHPQTGKFMRFTSSCPF